MLRLLVSVLLAGAPCGGPARTQQQQTLLERIRARMTENLERLPNYTCTMTMERSARLSPARRFKLLDVMRLEVAMVEGKELFAWPGARKFEDREIFQFATGPGAIGNGDFGLHARSVFQASGVQFEYRGTEQTGGRQAAKFFYRVPRSISGYQVRVGDNRAIVGYHGSFWADEATLDLIRLEVNADEIPAVLELAAVDKTLDYGRVDIGGTAFLLPRHSDLSLIDVEGNESRNRTGFSNCRQYAGESVISFADPPADAPPALPETGEEIRIPSGMLLEARLETRIDFTRAAVGDPVVAVVERDARRNKLVVAPKGARLLGRLMRLEKGRGRPGDYRLISLEFDLIEFAGRSGSLQARIESVGPIVGPAGARVRLAEDDPRLPRARGFYFTGNSASLARGLPLTLRTIVSGTMHKNNEEGK